MVYAADAFLRKFLGISSVWVSRDQGILNNYNYEDPTYPIFHLKFEFVPRDSKHPDYVSNRLLTSGPESAVQFLYSVGEPERARMMEKFIEMLKSISEKTPWYFQSVDGLGSLYSQGYPSKFASRGGSEATITIKTLESIDYKIHALKDLYRKAAYDRKFRRWILPINMRRFRMSILIGDFRQLAVTEDNYSINPRQALDALRDIDVFNGSNIGGKLLGRVNDGALSFVKRLQWWDNHYSCLLFDCQDCEFDMYNSSSISNLSHSNIKAFDSEFTINIGRVLETNTYSLLKYALSDNLLENLLKSSDENGVAKLSENLKNVAKPILPSWKEFQNLEREKGDNKRVILEDNGFGNVLGAGISEGVSALGIGGVLSGGTTSDGFLGSVGDFFGDTASELAQEALSMATENIAKNVYGNELYRSAAGVGLGILNGDLNQVAQNFSNPALAGALGINVETSGRPTPPNLRDGIPSNIQLSAPSVQRSLSDVQANLTGEGSDPRFQAIGRPGQSLFLNPDPLNKLFDQKNIELEKPRVETTMPDNVEFSEVRKETKLNPIKENLTGSTPKTSFDETNANLQGAGKKTDLTPSNADLTGAQPLKDLVPSNADLTGAQPLKDLVPSNADLTGAEALKDLIPSNANLVGTSSLNRFNNNNVSLTGNESLKELNPSGIDLVGASPQTSFNSQKENLISPNVATSFESPNVDLVGISPIRSFDEKTIDLASPSIQRTLTETNANLEGNTPVNKMDANIELEGSSPQRDLIETNANLQGFTTRPNNNLGVETLEGKEPMRNFSSPNVGNMTSTQSDVKDLGKETLLGANPLRDLTETNVKLQGSVPQTNISTQNVELKGVQNSITMQKNVELSGKTPQTSMDKNVNLQGSEVNSTSFGNVNLTGQGSKGSFDVKNVELQGSSPLTNTPLKNIGLVEKPTIGVIRNQSTQTKIELEGSTNRNTIQTRIELEEPNINNTASPKNIGLR